MTSHGQFLWSLLAYHYLLLISDQNDVDRRVIPVFTCTHRDARIIARSGRGRPQNDQGWSFKADSCLFSHVHVIADNLAHFMSADQKISTPDSNLAANGFLGT